MVSENELCFALHLSIQYKKKAVATEPPVDL